MDGEITRDDVLAELDAGNRVLLMVRHAERPHIDHDDPTFGEALPITEDGMRMSEAFGASFRAYADAVQFLASPLRRTVMTAECIARGMGVESPSIPTDEYIGNSTPYFADQHAVFELFRDGSFFRRIFEYMETGRQVGFNAPGPATDMIEERCLSRFTARLGIFTTHDLYIAVFLHTRGVVRRFTEANWTRFLDSAAIILSPDGSRSYAFLRAGLSDHICGVGYA